MFKYFLTFLFINTFIYGQKKPNILLICIDDLRNDLGCYGNSVVKSPNLDNIARRGVRFDKHYVQVAVCNPSRTSMLLGMRPDKSNVFTLSCNFKDHTPWAVSIPQYFAVNGYHSAGIGKIDHGKVPDPQNWSEPKLKVSSRTWSEKSLLNLKEWKLQAKESGESQGYINRRRANCIEMEDVADSSRFDGAITDAAILKLKELKTKKKPFFFAVGYVKPHMPFNAPRKYWDLYNRDTLSISTNKKPPVGAPVFALNTNYELRDYIDFSKALHPADGELTEKEARALIHGYYASISYMDSQVGRLIEALDSEGLTEQTIIVIWSDHGWKLGDFNGWGKMTNYELDTKSPLIIIDPRLKSSINSSRSQLVESLDIFPTLCDLADLPKPEQLDGISLVPLLKNASFTSRKAVYSQYLREKRKKNGALSGIMGHTVRTEEYRYISWRDFESGILKSEELYDLKINSIEKVNVVKHKEYSTVLKELKMLESKNWPQKE